MGVFCDTRPTSDKTDTPINHTHAFDVQNDRFNTHFTADAWLSPLDKPDLWSLWGEQIGMLRLSGLIPCVLFWNYMHLMRIPHENGTRFGLDITLTP